MKQQKPTTLNFDSPSDIATPEDILMYLEGLSDSELKGKRDKVSDHIRDLLLEVEDMRDQLARIDTTLKRRGKAKIFAEILNVCNDE